MRIANERPWKFSGSNNFFHGLQFIPRCAFGFTSFCGEGLEDLGAMHLPVLIVAEPKNRADELDSLGSLQSGQVAWTPYEVAKNTHDRWLYSGGISYSELARKLGITSHQVSTRISVYKYYLKDEIAEKLANGMYSITMPYYIAQWIKRLINYHPLLVEGLTEEYVRRQMLKKFENKCFK